MPHPLITPRPVYKYLRGEHATLLIQKGIVRIGTLLHYRSIEVLGAQHGDPSEGWYEQYEHVLSADYAPGAAPPLVQRVAGPNAQVSLRDVALSEETSSPDAFVYCVSEAKSRELMAAFGAEVCVEILSLRAFVQAVMPVMARWAEHFTVGPCHYTNTRRVSVYGITPWQVAFMKPLSYAHQREARVVWYPFSPPALPFLDLRIPALRAIVKPVEP